MFSHVTLGITQPFTLPGTLVFGTLAGEKIFIGAPFDGKPASVGNGTHVALLAPDRAAVDSFHATALAYSGSDEGTPGLRPRDHAHYHAAYLRAPDGNKLQAVCHRQMNDRAG